VSERRCRVCGSDAVRGLADGWYCDTDACLMQRTRQLRIDVRAPRAPGAYCAPTRCYCGLLDCPAIGSFVIVEPAPELWRGPLHVDATLTRAETLRRRMLRNAETTHLPRAERIRAEWDSRDEETWIDKL
jgi:hypothetical protein